MDDKWDRRFMAMSFLVASWSKDPSTQCGSVIVDTNKRIVSVGFNGFPKGTSDEETLYNNREEKYEKILHAETNSILFAQRDLTGYTMYVVPLPPCSRCMSLIIQSGIKRVVSIQPSDDLKKRWWGSNLLSFSMAKQAGIDITLYSDVDIETKNKV